MITSFKNSIAPLVASTMALTAHAYASTPVEKSLSQIVTNAFKSNPQTKDIPEERLKHIVADITKQLEKNNIEWTDQDAKNLKEGKSLVKDFEAIKKFYNDNKKQRLVSLFTTKVNSPTLTNIEKRALSDLKVVVEIQMKRGLATMALSNSKDIYMSLRDHCIKTGNALGEKGDKKSANALLKTLFLHGYAEDEEAFFVPGISGFNKPDSKADGANALVAGENVYALNAGVNLVTSNPHTPLLICPLIEKKGVLQADPKPFGGKAVVLRADGSALVLDIGKNGEINTEKGNLLTPEHPWWKSRNNSTSMDLRLPVIKKK